MNDDGVSISQDRLIELAELFRLAGDPSRLRIVLVCLKQARCVSEIAEATGLSASLVSHHLRLLRASRMLRADRIGRRVFYVAADDHVRHVIEDMVAHITEPDGEA